MIPTELTARLRRLCETLGDRPGLDSDKGVTELALAQATYDLISIVADLIETRATESSLIYCQEYTDDPDGFREYCAQMAVARRWNPGQLDLPPYPVCQDHAVSPLAGLHTGDMPRNGAS